MILEYSDANLIPIMGTDDGLYATYAVSLKIVNKKAQKRMNIFGKPCHRSRSLLSKDPFGGLLQTPGYYGLIAYSMPELYYFVCVVSYTKYLREAMSGNSITSIELHTGGTLEDIVRRQLEGYA